MERFRAFRAENRPTHQIRTYKTSKSDSTALQQIIEGKTVAQKKGET